MHTANIGLWQHHHVFNPVKTESERRTLLVVVITVIMMAAEIAAGWLFKSMALFADGWHMGTHAFALGISFMAYVFARRYAGDNRFAFGTWKIEILGAYTSAIILGFVGLFMIGLSVERLLHPLAIRYNDALIVAGIGLLVNVVSALILNSGHHEHEHDINLRSAYLHVIADALTSILAIAALLGAKFMRWNFLDPLMGIVGALLILRWTCYLLKDSGGVLLDREVNALLIEKIRKAVESDNDSKICDLHLWRVSQNTYACIVSVVSHQTIPAEEYKNRLKDCRELAHITVELNACDCAGA